MIYIDMLAPSPQQSRARRARACNDRTMIYIDTLCDRPLPDFSIKSKIINLSIYDDIADTLGNA